MADRPGLLWVVVGVVIVAIGAPVVDGTIGTIITILGALVTCYGVYLVLRSRPNGGT